MVLLLVLASLVGIVDCQFSTLLLNDHNNYRRREGAANMQKMKWSKQLEEEALMWARQCTNSHQNRGRGENLAMHSTTESLTQLVKKGVKMWYDEKSQYYPGRGFSSATGHYTQVVWADSDEVGCGVNICEANSRFPMQYMYLVCFYNPPGNFNNREPYVQGEACSQCPGQTCDNGLCTGPRQNNNAFGSSQSNTGNINSWFSRNAMLPNFNSMFFPPISNQQFGGNNRVWTTGIPVQDGQQSGINRVWTTQSVNPVPDGRLSGINPVWTTQSVNPVQDGRSSGINQVWSTQSGNPVQDGRPNGNFRWTTWSTNNRNGLNNGNGINSPRRWGWSWSWGNP